MQPPSQPLSINTIQPDSYRSVMLPIKREEVSIKPLKKAETQFLRLWVPSYCVALAAGTTNDFFDCFWLVWFDRFPLHFFPLEDPDCTKWCQNKMKERVKETLYWLNFTVKHAKGQTTGTQADEPKQGDMAESSDSKMGKPKEGDLALTCAACPQPGINLPASWESAPPMLKFLYTLFISVDANFRLKNRLRSRELVDPGLHTGLAYFVPQALYKEHILKHVSQNDISSCSRFAVLSRADFKSAVGLQYTGVGMCICMRHELIRPLGVGDLQKGERYCNMDFIVLSAVVGLTLSTLMIIYDIACQWSSNFATRMKELPSSLHITSNVHIKYAILKCHLHAHQVACQTPNSLNLKPGIGQTDGEGIERDWSLVNLAANSTKEMGAGSRHDTLNDIFGYHNWLKTTGLGLALRRKYRLAVIESKHHEALFNELSASIDVPGLLKKWESAVIDWEGDKTRLNPYISVTSYETEQDVRLQLLSKEAKAATSGSAILHEKSATAFLSMGLGLEETHLRGGGTWQNELMELQDQDICPPSAFDIDDTLAAKNMKDTATRLGERRREVPWIWRTAGVIGDGQDTELNEGLHIEWAKSRARSWRWSEEVLLCKEEMQRVHETLKHKASLWAKRCQPWKALEAKGDDMLIQGVAVFVQTQVNVYETLFNHFTSLWKESPMKAATNNNHNGEAENTDMSKAEATAAGINVNGREGDEEPTEGGGGNRRSNMTNRANVTDADVNGRGGSWQHG
ncbi:hypothetical protein BDN71DRAFT_1510315 [Pleurotus eryngii]|uniref:CxC2-like cysteine cluster KDZ transposase-associated domain-containing protein n=1 Tax=Pleurotus eryngii TaxID=5323 RepID=A0A9P5ZRP8_PLEER|nr:hypothetical protein BDN71DRAFT_1510315 [Pleurotus eryngii]